VLNFPGSCGGFQRAERFFNRHFAIEECAIDTRSIRVELQSLKLLSTHCENIPDDNSAPNWSGPAGSAAFGRQSHPFGYGWSASAMRSRSFLDRKRGRVDQVSPRSTAAARLFFAFSRIGGPTPDPSPVMRIAPSRPIHGKIAADEK